MKGQKLYIRTATVDDAGAIARFFEREGVLPPPGGGERLIGKLVGEIVALVVLELSEHSTLVIHHIFVAAELRRKRVGRAMIEEAAAFARTSGRTRLAIRMDAEPAAFFARLGFEPTCGRLERNVPQVVR
jgi:GNAT superfamily N-acetyltransferase